jgi:hypothetical protein
LALFLGEEHTSVRSVLRERHTPQRSTTDRQNYSSAAAKYATIFVPDSDPLPEIPSVAKASDEAEAL